MAAGEGRLYRREEAAVIYLSRRFAFATQRSASSSLSIRGKQSIALTRYVIIERETEKGYHMSAPIRTFRQSPSNGDRKSREISTKCNATSASRRKGA